jgi:hypothetical protein
VLKPRSCKWWRIKTEKSFHWLYNGKQEEAEFLDAVPDEINFWLSFPKGQEDWEMPPPIGAAFTGEPYTGAWRTKSASNVTAFGSVALDGSIPDLSASGAPIRFGYFRTSTQTGAFRTTRNGIDNYGVTVNQVPIPEPIPEPSTILGLGALALGAFLQRKLAKVK